MSKTKVLAFGETVGGSVSIVTRSIEKYLKDDFEFRYIDWHNWTLDQFRREYDWCDVVLTCLSSHALWFRFEPEFCQKIDFKKFLLMTHSTDEHATVRGVYNRLFSYGQACKCDFDMFPSDVTVHFMPNGVDPDNFLYRPRDGTLKTLGWVGRPSCHTKQPEWAKEISKITGIPLDLKGGDPVKPLSHISAWYQTVDLILVTAVPEWTSETGPLPPFEAIVSGIPAIGTPVGNFRDIPGPKFTTVEEAVAIVNDLRENPERMRAIALEQYNYVMSHNVSSVIADYWRKSLKAAHLRSSFQN